MYAGPADCDGPVPGSAALSEPKSPKPWKQTAVMPDSDEELGEREEKNSVDRYTGENMDGRS